MKPSQLALVAAFAAIELPLALGDSTVELPLDPRGNPIALPDDADEASALQANLRRNVEDHEREAAAACQHFYCGPLETPELPRIKRYTVGPLPSNDFAALLPAGAEDVVVTEAPMFTAAECARVIAMAEREGGGLPTSKSGKYQIGKAWIKDMPGVLGWFNEALESKLFPSLAGFFPELVTDPSALRAHSVAILKYNESHPQTDIHIDDGLLAFTVALSPSDAFVGGGTYFEALGRVVHMEQGHVTFRPGAVRHAGWTLKSGLRYVVGGFIALSDRVEHVRRLNERGNRLLLQADPSDADLVQAERLFGWALLLNPDCSLCHLNRADAQIQRGDAPAAEGSLRRQLQLLPHDADAYFGLGVALRAQERNGEAIGAYRSALSITENDPDTWSNLASALAKEERRSEEQAAYREALGRRPDDVKAWLNLAISYTGTDQMEESEGAFRSAAEAAPSDARPPLNLGRLLTKLSRPAEAIDAFYTAAVTNSEYFEEVKLGIGTARAQQGRLAEATTNFESAARMNPKNEKLAASIALMSAQAVKLEAAAAARTNALGDVCGTSCQDVVDGAGTQACALTWAEGCGDAPPPDGRTADATVAELCAESCTFFAVQGELELGEGNHM